MSEAPKKAPLCLIIMDGWGYNPNPQDNAVAEANTPVIDGLQQTSAYGLIQASGEDVGLPGGQMGNSEVGHINIGSGRVVYQELTRIGKAIAERTFHQNPVLTKAVDDAVAANKAVHVMGLLSPGGVHSHEDHLLAMIELAAERGAEKIYLHAFLDGRDTPPRSAEASLVRFSEYFKTLGKGRVASVIGRYYAMDRDNRWDRVEQCYRLLSEAKGEYRYDDAVSALQAAYQRDENDEFVKASVIQAAGEDSAAIAEGDAVIFMNFRADRARELSRAFVDQTFTGFARGDKLALSHFVMLTQYAADIDTECAYPPEDLVNTLGEWLAKHEKTQLRISETEKYAHVTFFFNGGKEALFEGEDRILIPSPQVATYDLQPEMNSEKLTDDLVSAIESGKYDVIICNYPNGDMVGHTGDFQAAVKACEAVDHSVGRVVTALQKVGGECLITADHGNAEKMRDASTGQAHTAHTSEPVPLIYFGRKGRILDNGRLSDLAPTMLYLLGMEVPEQMTGHSIVELL